MARLVYSSGPGGATAGCPRCGEKPCRCPVARSRPPEEHSIRVRRERSGRKGKTVTVAGPFHLVRADAQTLLRDLKRRCGTGGTLKSVDGDGEPNVDLEIQGDHAETLIERLAALGYPAKRAGG